MRERFSALLVALVALVLATGLPAHAQAPAPERAQYSQDELDQLLAPIALYPDELLAQVLMAATYPLEVVQAARFVQQNPSLAGDALDDAVAQRNWDPSVQSLAAFPQVLAMMNDNLEWTERLGDAFLADQQRVMDTVQRLRRRAEAAGSLGSTPEQLVRVEPDVIVIEPAQPDIIYVPVYDPLVVYGPWWAPAYPPWFWYPSPIYGYPIGPVFGIGVVFGTGHAVSHHHRGWAHPDWHRHHIEVDAHDNRFWNGPGRRPPPSGTWQHSPEHRRGVAYPDPVTRDRFAPIDPTGVRRREDFRGRDNVPPAPARAAAPSAGQARPAPGVSAPGSTAPTPGAPRPVAPLAAPSERASTPSAAPSERASTPSAARPVAPPSAARAPAPSGMATPGAPSAPLAAPRPIAPPATSSTPRAAPPSTPMFDPGVSRRQAQENAMRGFESRRSVPLAPSPTLRAPTPSAPSAASPAPPMRMPAAPTAPSRPPAALPSAPSRPPAALPSAPSRAPAPPPAAPGPARR